MKKDRRVNARTVNSGGSCQNRGGDGLQANLDDNRQKKLITRHNGHKPKITYDLRGVPVIFTSKTATRPSTELVVAPTVILWLIASLVF